MTFLLILLCVLISSVGQLLLKFGMDQVAKTELSALPIFQAAWKVFFNPYVFSGITCYAIGLLVWLYILSRTQLSYAYPLMSLSYAAIPLLAWHFFGESLGALKVSGIFLVMLGVLLITRS